MMTMLLTNDGCFCRSYDVSICIEAVKTVLPSHVVVPYGSRVRVWVSKTNPRKKGWFKVRRTSERYLVLKKVHFCIHYRLMLFLTDHGLFDSAMESRGEVFYVRIEPA